MGAEKPKTYPRWGKPLDPGLESSLRRFIRSVGCVSASGTLLAGQFLVAYALLVGARDFEIGLLAAVATWAGLGSFLAPAIIEKWRSNKLPALFFLGLGRSGWLIVVVPALLGRAKEPWTLWLLLAASGVFALSGSMIYPALWSWLRNLVPGEIRGRYLARQNIMANLTSIAALQVGGRFLDVWKGRFGKGNPYGFIICYAVALVVATIGLSIRKKVPEPPFSRDAAHPSLRRLMLLPLADPRFKSFILFESWWNFSVMIVAPFTMVYMLKSLSIPYSTVALLTNTSTVAALLSARVWGRLIDKFTPKPVLSLCYPLMCLLPFMWILATPESYLILYLLLFVGGFFSAGMGLAFTNMILRIAPREHGSAYYAAENAIVNLAGAVGPLLGGWLAQSVQGVEVQLAEVRIYHLHFVFLAAAVVRVGGFFFLRRIREPREKGALFMLRVMRRVRGLNPVAASWDAAHAAVAMLVPLLRTTRLLPPRFRNRPPGEEKTPPRPEGR